MIDAVYLVNEYLQPFLDAAVPNMEFCPGNSADQAASTEFILYTVTPNTGYDLYMLHQDIVSYRIVHTDFEKLYKAAEIFFSKLNVDHVAISNSQIRFQETFVTGRGSGNDHFSDGDDFYFVNLSLNLQYTVLS